MFEPRTTTSSRSPARLRRAGQVDSDSSSGDSDVRLEVSKMPKNKRGSREPEAIPTEEIALDSGRAAP